MWISRQASRHHVDCAAYESALTAKIQLLDQHLALLHDIFAQKRSRAGADEMQRQAAWTANQESDVQTNEANQGARSGNCPEFSYTAIQSTTDAILELAYWICEPDFDMDLGRLSPGWRQHASSLEQVVHYVQVVESMRETVSSGPFHHRHLQHPIDLAEDLAQCQEVIDYQRTLFGEILRNNGLAWRSLGLPAMDRLIESTQLWILQLAKTATARIQAEVQWAIHAYQQQLEELSNKDGARGGWALDLDKCPDMDTKMANGSSSRSMAEVMELVLQGALLTNSCLELVGIPCPALVTSWLILSTPYCWYALTSRQQFIAKMSIRQQNKVSMQKSTSPLGFRIAASQEMDEIVQSSTSSPLSTGSKVGGESLASARMSRGSFLKTMAIFENVSRLLQCLMEMREGEEILIQESKLRFGSYESSSGSASATAVDSEGLDELAMMSRGVFNNSLRESATDGESSTASSDQDDAMDGVTTALSPGANTILGSTSGHASSPSLLSSTHQSHQNQHHLHPHHPSRSPPFSSRRKSPISSMSPTVLERLKATEELAAILVEASLELCSSMAEALGQGCSPSPPVPVSTTTTSSPSARGLSMTPAAIGKSLLFRTGDVSNPFAYEASIRGLDTPSPPPLLSLPPTLNGHHGINTSPAATSAHYYHHQHQQQQQQRNRGALAVATLTTLGGGGAMASGSGGVGLIYVQFVVRFLTKVIEFSGVDFAQDQRLVVRNVDFL
ncbi:hypothetical protein BGZ73_008428 [Actinomortierella ambigua]|nr:hypothetical protein BGZ73_008428 [Actinomortierella ambigua]